MVHKSQKNILIQKASMIFDRTLSDVTQAVEIREKKVKGGQELTESDIEILSRGFLTVETLNRISQKQSEIKEILNTMGYYNTPVVVKTWGLGDYFLKSDLENIVKNNEILRKAYYVFATTPKEAVARAHFEELNKIEKTLFDLGEMADDMMSRFRLCGTFNCGG